MANHLPDGWHSLTPRLIVADPARLVRFLHEAFDASGELAENGPAVLRIGDSLAMVSGTEQREAVPSVLYLYVADADATYRRALAAGAHSLEAPADMPYGDRRAMVADPCGNTWQIATYRGERPTPGPAAPEHAPASP